MIDRIIQVGEKRRRTTVRSIFASVGRSAGVALVVLCGAVISPPNAAADLSWLKEASDCRSFSDGLSSYVGSLGDIHLLPPAKREELVVVLKEACGPRFSSCDFAVCKTIGKRFASQGATGAAIETNPLAWLNNPSLSCDELVGQIKSRYAPLGKFSELPQKKKEELRAVLDVSCSERFAHCDFKSCRKDAADENTVQKAAADSSTASVQGSAPPQADETIAPPTPTVEQEPYYKIAAREELERLYRELQTKRRHMISLAEEKERMQSAGWEQLANPDEVAELEERRRITRERRESEEKPADFFQAPFRSTSPRNSAATSPQMKLPSSPSSPPRTAPRTAPRTRNDRKSAAPTPGPSQPSRMPALKPY